MHVAATAAGRGGGWGGYGGWGGGGALAGAGLTWVMVMAGLTWVMVMAIPQCNNPCKSNNHNQLSKKLSKKLFAAHLNMLDMLKMRKSDKLIICK